MEAKTTITTYFKLAFLFGLLVSVRYFEHLFYDPLQAYFEQDYLHVGLPVIDKLKLFLHLFLRYGLNTLISIAILWVAYKNKANIRFSMYFYTIAFVILIVLFYGILFSYSNNYYFLVFYIRRFIIQPLFVFLLLPAFYYQKNF